MNNRTSTPLSDDENDDSGVEILAPLAQDMSPAIAAEINQQVATAHKFPRRRDKEISDEIMGRATLNPEIAAECMYTLKRGDKAITGASIRFAEIVRASFGNVRVAARFVRLDLDDPQRGAVIVEAVALDLQANQAEVIPVRRSVMTSGKGGRKATVYSADMINMTVNAASSLARRNAILAVIPKALWIEGYQRVVKVLQGDAQTLGARRTAMVEAFGRVGVKPERVFEALGVKSIEDITLEHMPTLAGFASAIKDGETPDSVFGRAIEDGPNYQTAGNVLKDQPGEGPKPQEATGQQPTAEKRAAQVADAQEAGADTTTGEMPAGGQTVAAGELATGESSKPQPKQAAAPAAGSALAKGAAATAKAAAVQASSAAAKAHLEDLAAIETPSQYRDHALAWVAAATDATAARARWTAERAKRTELDLSEETLAEISTAYQAKVRALGAAS